MLNELFAAGEQAEKFGQPIIVIETNGEIMVGVTYRRTRDGALMIKEYLQSEVVEGVEVRVPSNAVVHDWDEIRFDQLLGLPPFMVARIYHGSRADQSIELHQVLHREAHHILIHTGFHDYVRTGVLVR